LKDGDLRKRAGKKKKKSLLWEVTKEQIGAKKKHRAAAKARRGQGKRIEKHGGRTANPHH